MANKSKVHSSQERKFDDDSEVRHRNKSNPDLEGPPVLERRGSRVDAEEQRIMSTETVSNFISLFQNLWSFVWGGSSSLLKFFVSYIYAPIIYPIFTRLITPGNVTNIEKFCERLIVQTIGSQNATVPTTILWVLASLSRMFVRGISWIAAFINTFAERSPSTAREARDARENRGNSDYEPLYKTAFNEAMNVATSFKNMAMPYVPSRVKDVANDVSQRFKNVLPA